jgi:5-methylcytosine-specific restriction endonuclease McrA
MIDLTTLLGKFLMFLRSSVGRAGGCDISMGRSKDRRSYASRREYLINAVQKRRQRIRQMAVDYMGGRCSICGYDRCIEALEFHHLDASEKDFGISSKGYTRSWEMVKQELDKCVILCANCHREVHAGMLQLPQETVVEKLGELKEA